MDYRVTVSWQASAPDGRAEGILSGIRALHIDCALGDRLAPDVEPAPNDGPAPDAGRDAVASVQVSDLYFLRGDLTPDQVEQLCHELLVDPIVQSFQVVELSPTRQPAPTFRRSHSSTRIQVTYHPGVTDSIAENLILGARRLGIDVQRAATGTAYTLAGELDEAAAHRIAAGLLCNSVIQDYTLGEAAAPFSVLAPPSSQVEQIPIREMDDDELLQTSVERVLFLDGAELDAVRAYYRSKGRDPTDVELETLAQTWSEHCVHKTFKARIDYTCHDRAATRLIEGRLVPEPERQQIDGILKTFLRAPTERLAKPWVRSAFVDNAGILELNQDWDVSFKVETHNHPSALEPFGGANTGVGGVVRDVIGVSARPIANTDVLCFGPQDLPAERLPGGALHPRRIAAGVIAGIEDYGNKMGIPTVNGAILYDPGYTGNPLVYCGCLGIAPRDSHRNRARAGDLCVAVGGRTGRDGLHGATFSSAELTHETGETVGSVVQIGNPITEKTFLEVILVARDEGLYTSITDCGAGGFSSAVGEMGAEVGVRVDLAAAPLKYPGLRPWEVWLSEAQERMILAVPRGNLERLQQICDERDVELTVIGHFTGDRQLTLCYGERVVGSLEMDFLHDGIPRRHLEAVWEGGKHEPGAGPAPAQAVTTNGQPAQAVTTSGQPAQAVTTNGSGSARSADFGRAFGDLNAVLLRLLASPNIASKEAVIRRYDHEVQGATVVKPLTGVLDDGPSDGAVLRPLELQLEDGGSYRGLALSCGLNPAYGRLDPYAMAWAAIDEALRNAVAVGADPDQVALLDNFCWGNPNLPDRLGDLVRAAQGCHDAALHYGAPFVSGKDSLNNEYVDADGHKTPIPPTLLISALGFVPDVRRAVTMDIKAPGSRLYLLGETRDELGGSALAAEVGLPGGRPPAPEPVSIETMRRLHAAIRDGRVRACHDCSEGGLAVAAAEMAFAGGIGLTLEAARAPAAGLPAAPAERDAVVLFAESSGRFLVEVAAGDTAAFEAILSADPALPWAQIGRTGGERLRVLGIDGRAVIDTELDVLKGAWQGVIH